MLLRPQGGLESYIFSFSIVIKKSYSSFSVNIQSLTPGITKLWPSVKLWHLDNERERESERERKHDRDFTNVSSQS